MGKIRIIGGFHRSRQLEVLDADGLRPTLDRVKETLFNWLGQELVGQTCLDLFAGSGSLAFEAVSRNAAQVTLIEKNLLAYKQLEKNKQILKADKCKIYNQDALVFLQSNTDLFDIIFVDPPYASDLLKRVLPLLKNKLTVNGVIYIEYKNQIDLTGFQIIKLKKAGVVNFALLKKELT